MVARYVIPKESLLGLSRKQPIEMRIDLLPLYDIIVL